MAGCLNGADLAEFRERRPQGLRASGGGEGWETVSVVAGIHRNLFRSQISQVLFCVDVGCVELDRSGEIRLGGAEVTQYREYDTAI